MKNSFLIILFFFSWLSAIAQILISGPTDLICAGEPVEYFVFEASAPVIVFTSGMSQMECSPMGRLLYKAPISK